MVQPTASGDLASDAVVLLVGRQQTRPALRGSLETRELSKINIEDAGWGLVALSCLSSGLGSKCLGVLAHRSGGLGDDSSLGSESQATYSWSTVWRFCQYREWRTHDLSLGLSSKCLGVFTHRNGGLGDDSSLGSESQATWSWSTVWRFCQHREWRTPDRGGLSSHLACSIDFIDYGTFWKKTVTRRYRSPCNPGEGSLRGRLMYMRTLKVIILIPGSSSRRFLATPPGRELGLGLMVDQGVLPVGVIGLGERRLSKNLDRGVGCYGECRFSSLRTANT